MEKIMENLGSKQVQSVYLVGHLEQMLDGG
jgi:hypothetical protein